MAKETAPIEALDAFIERHEAQAQAAGLTVCRVQYPGAASRSWDGRYSGFPVEDGKPAAIYSDGSKNN